MSSRFHNKYHRHNHHSRTEGDPRYPDASHDPIASSDSPFVGPFFLWGSLSATSMAPFDVGIPGPAAHFDAPPVSGIPGTAIVATAEGGTALNALGNVNIQGAVDASGNITANDIVLTGDVITNYAGTDTLPLTATGEFLILRLNGQTRAIRLWYSEVFEN